MKFLLTRLFPLFLLLQLIHLQVYAQVKSGKVTGIKDGDTIEMLIDGKQVVVRLEGIDCPEKGQAFGDRAKKVTASLAFGKTVSVEIKSYDQFKRALGVVSLPGNRVLNEELLASGMAWHFKKYNRNKKWAQLEEQARAARIGLWSEPNAMPPWEFRKQKRRK